MAATMGHHSKILVSFLLFFEYGKYCTDCVLEWSNSFPQAFLQFCLIKASFLINYIPMSCLLHSPLIIRSSVVKPRLSL